MQNVFNGGERQSWTETHISLRISAHLPCLGTISVLVQYMCLYEYMSAQRPAHNPHGIVNLFLHSVKFRSGVYCHMQCVIWVPVLSFAAPNMPRLFSYLIQASFTGHADINVSVTMQPYCNEVQCTGVQTRRCES
jgi:hypothetical protein